VQTDRLPLDEYVSVLEGLPSQTLDDER
jgi:hypothetical protein